ncbi:MAG: hypothetical protein IJE74_04140 [Clostridia bacterium]|nr:hypothetical protein [Clostridia bacterium]
MSHFIEEFYYGNIEPQESITELKAEIKKKLDELSQTEEQFTAKLTDEEKEMFIKYASQSSEFLCVSNADSFISGFRLGVKFTYDTFVTD